MTELSTQTIFLRATAGLQGTLRVPGDKSISHRAVLIGSVNTGTVKVTGFLRSADTLATVAAVRALGVDVAEEADDILIAGRGWEGLTEPEDVIDAANSGTLIRLLPGLVASLPMLCYLTGDSSIRRRPMARILEPLAAMGAGVWGRRNNTLPPILIRGGSLRGITHHLPVASAQVKSCILLAGLRAAGETAIIEPATSRDHTERMIAYGGGRVERETLPDGRGLLRVWPVEHLSMSTITVPGDFSSAAFFIVAACLTPNSHVVIENVGLNPTRTGLLDVLREMGADLQVEPTDMAGPEPVGRITARTSVLKAVDVGGAQVPNLIDELPLFLLAASKATGLSRLRGAAELRAKESDRLQVMGSVLRTLGVTLSEYPDGMDVRGNPAGWQEGTVEARGDHRMAMVGAVAGVVSHKGVAVDNTDCVNVSYPGFLAALESLGGRWMTTETRW